MPDDTDIPQTPPFHNSSIASPTSRRLLTSEKLASKQSSSQQSAFQQPASQHLTAEQQTQLLKILETETAALGFEKVGIASIDLQQDRERFEAWIAQGFHADMDYLTQHGDKRFQPDLLVPGTLSIVCVRLNYLFPGLESAKTLKDPRKAYISRYALGRDYHKVLRNKLQKLASRLTELWHPFGYRVFTDSAPVLEKPLALQAGLGWMGKHTLILDKSAGSWFFLGELFTNLPLPTSQPIEPQCGKCRACLTICPTQAIIAPYRLDARRCISYLTIENKGPIPHALRPLMGNRVFGCDDCQLICPWNRWAQTTNVADFSPRHALEASDLVTLLNWNEAEFLAHTTGSALRRTGYFGWTRNLSVAAGNAPGDTTLINALYRKKALLMEPASNTPDWLLEHMTDAINRQKSRLEKNDT